MRESSEDLDGRIARAVAHIDGIGTLALFGSGAKSQSRHDSDLDIAILPVGGDSTRRNALLSKTAGALARLVPSGRVDVVLIDEAPELLRHRIFEHGRVVVQRDPEDWRAWRVRTMREHGDREPFRHLLRSAQRRRPEEGRSGGRSGRALGSLERARRLSG